MMERFLRSVASEYVSLLVIVPQMVLLQVLPRLMNGMVVSFMKQKGAGDKVDLHASEKALLG
jgi:hypothetical protein